MLAIKSKHKAPNHVDNSRAEKQEINRSMQREIRSRNGACQRFGSGSCQLVLFSPSIFVSNKRQTETLRNDGEEVEEEEEQNDTEICFNAAHFFMLFFTISFCFFVASSSSSPPHIVLHLCSDSSKNSVCLSLLPCSALKRTATCATS